MGAQQQFSLKWNNYSHHIVTAFDVLREDEELTDVTLSCEGQRIRAHKVLLSACSSYFKDTFSENPCKHPVVILKGVSFQDLQAVVKFMYNGQVNVTQDHLQSFLQTAELLEIKGLTDINDKASAIKKKLLPLSVNTVHARSTNASNTVEDIYRKRDPQSQINEKNCGIGPEGKPNSTNSGQNISCILHSLTTTSASTPDETEIYENVIMKFEEINNEDYEKNNQSEDNEGPMEILGIESSNKKTAITDSLDEIGSGNQHRIKMNDIIIADSSQERGKSRSTKKRKLTGDDDFEFLQQQESENYNLNYEMVEENDEEDDDTEADMEPYYEEDYEEGFPEPLDVKATKQQFQFYPNHREQKSSVSLKPLPKLVKASSLNLAKVRDLGRQLTTTPNFSFSGELSKRAKKDHIVSLKEEKRDPGGVLGEMGGPFVCDLCGKKYQHHRSLNDHRKFHTGATTCPVCHKAFSKVANMRAHFSAQHLKPENDETSFSS